MKILSHSLEGSDALMLAVSFAGLYLDLLCCPNKTGSDFCVPLAERESSHLIPFWTLACTCSNKFISAAKFNSL